jgi:phage terminase large subunit-like protein
MAAARRRLSRGERNIAWIERYCRVPEGHLVGKPLKLTPAQKRWLREIYDTPTRLFILSMGRKNAKTTLAAMLLLLHLCGPEAKNNSQLFSSAQSRDQAALLFNLAAKIVRMSPELLSVILIRETAKQLICRELGTMYRALSAEASTSHGLSPAFVVHDELGQVRGPRSEQYEALETASAAQAEPLSIIISTQAPSDSDVLSLLIDDAKTGADPRMKLELYTVPTDDERAQEGKPPLDAFGKEAIRLANPHFDVFMNQDEVLRQASDAKRMPTREASYRNLILNQRVETKSPFIAQTIWLENGQAPGELGGELYGGLDLSSVSDLTALVLCARREGGVVDVYPTFWLPREGLAEKARYDRVPYDVWADQGYLQTTPGKSIEYEFIAEHLRGIFDAFNVKTIAFDRYQWNNLRACLERADFSAAELERFNQFGQGFVSMSPAIRELESLLLGAKLRHGGHPVLTMCAANATVMKDPAENRKFVKGKATGRIDGMVALAMAVGVMGSQATVAAPPKPALQFW